MNPLDDQQTFRASFQANGYEPVTREMIAQALEKIARDLRAPFCSDSEHERKSAMAWNQRLEINGHSWMGDISEQGVIHLVVRGKL